VRVCGRRTARAEGMELKGEGRGCEGGERGGKEPKREVGLSGDTGRGRRGEGRGRRRGDEEPGGGAGSGGGGRGSLERSPSASVAAAAAAAAAALGPGKGYPGRPGAKRSGRGSGSGDEEGEERGAGEGAGEGEGEGERGWREEGRGGERGPGGPSACLGKGRAQVSPRRYQKRRRMGEPLLEDGPGFSDDERRRPPGGRRGRGGGQEGRGGPLASRPLCPRIRTVAPLVSMVTGVAPGQRGILDQEEIEGCGVPTRGVQGEEEGEGEAAGGALEGWREGRRTGRGRGRGARGR